MVGPNQVENQLTAIPLFVWNVLDLVLLPREQHVGIGLRQVDVGHSLPLTPLGPASALCKVSRENPTALVFIGEFLAKNK